MTPIAFTPGGRNLFSITVHNDGPDNAGTENLDEKPVRVFSGSVVFPSEQSPPFEIVGVLTGNCWIERYSEPLQNGHWMVQFIYYFDPIAAGESRTCTSDIYFSAKAPSQIATRWLVASGNDNDINPSNNRFDYTFVAAPPAPPMPVPSGSFESWLAMGLGILLAAHHATERFRARVNLGPYVASANRTGHVK